MPRNAVVMAGVVAAFAALALLMLVPQAHAAVSWKTLGGAPLTINIGQDLSCQVWYQGDQSAEVYNANDTLGDCGTMLMADPPSTGIFYAPAFGQTPDASHAGSAAKSIDSPVPHTNYAYVSQTPTTGSGTAANPYTVVTIVDAGSARIRETDTYANGDQSFSRMDLVTNNDAAAHKYRLWIALDCFLFAPKPNNSDAGYGWADPPGTGGRVACTRVPNSLSGRYEMLAPLAGTTQYKQGFYDDVWTAIGNRAAFQDTVDRFGTQPCPGPAACAPEDNGMGLSCDFQLAPGQSYTCGAKLEFSPGPPPNQPPTVDFTFDNSANSCTDSAVLFTADARDSDGYVAGYHWTFGDPAGMTSDASGAQFTYTDDGFYIVTLTVTDNRAATAVVSHAVHANADTNCCPNLHAVQDLTLTEGQFLRFLPAADDWEGDPLTFAVTPALPQGATLDPASGYLFWRSAEGAAGDYPMTLHITDGKDHSTSPESCHDAASFTVKILAKVPGTVVVDSDLDGIEDLADNCPGVPNRDQADANHNGIGDACEGAVLASPGGQPAGAGPITPSDSDGDGVPDATDNCPGIANPGQADLDHDRSGDVCDSDLDGDGVPQIAPPGSYLDNCPVVPNPDQKDIGHLGAGDACRGTAQPAGHQGSGVSETPTGGEAYGAASRPYPYVAFGAAVGIASLILAMGAMLLVLRRR